MSEKKLKTLKDIEGGCDVCSQGGDLAYSDDLRSVAREWIKELEKMNNNNDLINEDVLYEKMGVGLYRHPFFYGDSSYLGEYSDNVINWIKYFFNLNEEDI